MDVTLDRPGSPRPLEPSPLIWREVGSLAGIMTGDTRPPLLHTLSSSSASPNEVTTPGYDIWTPVAGSSDRSTRASSVDGSLSPIQQGYAASTAAGLLRARAEDVAIVGMACRTAGGVDSPSKLWQLLMDKKVASGEVPRHRWEPWARRDPRNAAEISKTVSRGYFVEDLEMFDAAFFGISPAEAEQMDPHQRLALELTWQALEDAGIDPKSLAGSDTAVFLGIDSDDYSRLLMEDIPNIEAWMGIGTAPHGVANRVSYHLDLMGPSAAVDAACATSLVALHIGRQAIANRESEIAIVGGTNVLLGPALTRMLGKAGALSPDGECRSFDDAANGYARGEGGAVIILKRFSSAITDGDNILAVLKGSAVAQDGKTDGIMAPNAKAQELVGRQALARADIDPLTVSFVECHATSTQRGDPTEMMAIAGVYGSGAGRPAEQPVLVGSVKPNVGHLEPAAGGIGLIKAVMALRKGLIPPQANLTKLNTRVPWDTNGLKVVQEVTQWPEVDGPRRAAVCSYGYGGTVSHSVIEEFPTSAFLGAAQPIVSGPVILALSSLQEKRLAAQAVELAGWLSSPAGATSSLVTIANTLSQRRAQQDHRVAFVVSTHAEAIDALKHFAAGSHSSLDSVVQGRVLGSAAGPSRQPVWVFSGHGAQWADMGKELLQDPIFRDAILPLDCIVKEAGGFSPLEALKTGDLETTERVQILTYIVQVGLSQVLQAQGLQPSAVIGHSVGEIAASVVAGCLRPEEGALVVTRRAKLYGRIRDKQPGAMALVNLSFEQVAAELGDRQDLVAAIMSSPSTCVVSGEADAVATYADALELRGVKAFRVKTDVAFHSPMLGELAAPLREVLAGSLHPRQPKVPIYSTSNPNTRTAALRDTDYWVHNMISPVRLTAAIKAAADDGHRIFVEVSSHPIVLHSVNETLVERGLDESEFATVATLRRGVSATKSIKAAVATLHTRGGVVDWQSQFGHKRFWCQHVPRTPFVPKFYYRQVETAEFGQVATHDVEKHTLLGERVAVAGTNMVLYSTKLDDKTKPFPGTHPLDGTEIIPAAVYINTFHHATGGRVLSNIRLKVPVSMSSETRNVQVLVRNGGVTVSSSAELGKDAPVGDQTWVSHSSASWSSLRDAGISNPEPPDPVAIKQRIGTLLPNSFSVDYLAKIGVAGIAFPWQVVEHYGNEKEMLAKVDNDPSGSSLAWDPYSWAPILDAATSIGSTIFFNDPRLRIVNQIDRMDLYSREALPKIGYIYVQEAADAVGPAAHVSVLGEAGQVLAKFTSMRFAEVEGASGVSGSVESLVHRMDWVPPKFAERPRQMDQVVLVSRDNDVSMILSNQLRAKTIFTVSGADALGENAEALNALLNKGSAVIYVPGEVESMGAVAAATEEFVWETTRLVKLLASRSLSDTAKLLVFTNRVFAGETPTALAHGALYGLARIIASEHPDLWGGLVDNEERTTFPQLAAKYVHDHDVIRVVDGLPRRAIMRPLSKDQKWPGTSAKTLLPKPEGTYIMTGGFGDLGLETLSFLVGKGARRIVSVSRRGLPPRRKWASIIGSDAKLATAIGRVQALEKLGASIHSLAIDMSAPAAGDALLSALDALSLPPVLGVIHAAGIVEDSLLVDTTVDSYTRVLAPKVRGAMVLHDAFQPGTLDFFVMYSSIGQLVGTAGQASYASGNAFLDGLATYRRSRGDNAVAFQFSAWKGMGLAADADFLSAELEAKGVTDITSEEAFRAWEYMGQYDVEGAVITRVRPVLEGEPVALPLLDDVTPRRPKVSTVGTDGTSGQDASASGDARPGPPAGPELDAWLAQRIRGCIANVLKMDPHDVEDKTPLSDMGVDSVMTIALRRELQGAMGIRTPPTLTWNHPTLSHLLKWFAGKFAET